MSSSAFDVTLDLHLRPSSRALRGLFALHAGAILLTLLAQPPRWAGLTLAALYALSWINLRRHPVFGYGPRALVRLMLDPQGRWRVEDARGARQDARLLPGSVVQSWMIVLNFRLENGARHSRALLGDELEPDALRRLRARLLNPHPSRGRPKIRG
ncbi:MAG: hypothetical protein QJR02_00975 [Sinobacteraceae bacterium]|nr:hypothetical protein [Nevskiaceae bacterium]